MENTNLDFRSSSKFPTMTSSTPPVVYEGEGSQQSYNTETDIDMGMNIEKEMLLVLS